MGQMAANLAVDSLHRALLARGYIGALLIPSCWNRLALNYRHGDAELCVMFIRYDTLLRMHMIQNNDVKQCATFNIPLLDQQQQQQHWPIDTWAFLKSSSMPENKFGLLELASKIQSSSSDMRCLHIWGVAVEEL